MKTSSTQRGAGKPSSPRTSGSTAQGSPSRKSETTGTGHKRSEKSPRGEKAPRSKNSSSPEKSSHTPKAPNKGSAVRQAGRALTRLAVDGGKEAERVRGKVFDPSKSVPAPSGGVTSRRPLFEPLFRPSDAFCREALEKLPAVLNKIMPLNRAHRADLPAAIHELSEILTSERGALGRSYWSAPRFVSAYLRYFLPWNLVRLTRLLSGLPLPVPAETGGVHPPLMVDLGCGPLTFPLALWLARPDWRALPLTVLCVDTAPRPMELGRSLLEAVASSMDTPFNWRIQLVRAPFLRALREVRGIPHLLTAGNVLNEWRDRGDTTREERLTDLATSVRRLIGDQGSALFVEPGTRLGGGLTAALRECALEEGLTPIAPCTHVEPCPLMGRRDRGWCHAVQDAGGPVWLAKLAADAGLPKDSLSLSFMLLRSVHHAEMIASPFARPGLAARILSDAFFVPNMGNARYACCQEGLAIIPAAAGLPSGAVTLCEPTVPPRRDAKSGAVELHWIARE